jgi:hypothetical protein
VVAFFSNSLMKVLLSMVVAMGRVQAAVMLELGNRYFLCVPSDCCSRL